MRRNASDARTVYTRAREWGSMIQLTSVSKVYGKKSQQFVALQDVSLSIEPGSSVAIVGKSGSGKSTLMHVMSGLDRVSAGTVVDRKSTRLNSSHSRASRMPSSA